MHSFRHSFYYIFIRVNSYKEVIKHFLIERQYSPEQISGLHKRHLLPFVSHETIYKWIWEEKRKGIEEKLYLHLRQKGRRHRKRVDIFSLHEKIVRKLNLLFYLARPYHWWERGSNENLKRTLQIWLFITSWTIK